MNVPSLIFDPVRGKYFVAKKCDMKLGFLKLEVQQLVVDIGQVEVIQLRSKLKALHNLRILSFYYPSIIIWQRFLAKSCFSKPSQHLKHLETYNGTIFHENTILFKPIGRKQTSPISVVSYCPFLNSHSN